jgi:hypothetical protein
MRLPAGKRAGTLPSNFGLASEFLTKVNRLPDSITKRAKRSDASMANRLRN